MNQHHHVAIDGNEANTQNRVGSNVYAFQILTHLEQLAQNRENVSFTILLREPPVADMPRERNGWHYQVIAPSLLWTQLAEPTYLYLHQKEFDLLFTPGHYAPRLSPVPYISSVMDLAFLHFPKQFKRNDQIKLKNWTKYSVKHAQHLITISEFSKKDIIDQYHIPGDKIDVVFPAVSEIKPASNKESTAFFHQHHIQKPYFLFIGTFQPRKNLIRLVEAYEQLCRQISSQQLQTRQTRHTKMGIPQLILAGKTGWLADETLERIQRSPFFDYIIMPGYVPDELKPVLYQQSLASILVGLYEGFGIPPLESLHYDAVPVVSNLSSLPEVVGEAGILVDPYDVQSITEGLTRAYRLTSKEKLDLLHAGKEQLEKFSWVKSAQQVLDLIIQSAQQQTKRRASSEQ